MISPEKEEVLFPTSVNVNEGERKGNVEKWLLEIELLMILSLKKVNRESLYDKQNRLDWI